MLLRAEGRANLHDVHSHLLLLWGKLLRGHCNSAAVIHLCSLTNCGKLFIAILKKILGDQYFNVLLQMPNTEGQDLLALQKAIHSSNHQSSRQKDWHPEKMTEIQPHVSGIISSLYINITDVS